MPGARNPIVPTMSRILGAVARARHDAKQAADRIRAFAEEQVLEQKLADVSIQFIGASGLPKMDIVGLADPYFVAKIDNCITFVYYFHVRAFLLPQLKYTVLGRMCSRTP